MCQTRKIGSRVAAPMNSRSRVEGCSIAERKKSRSATLAPTASEIEDWRTMPVGSTSSTSRLMPLTETMRVRQAARLKPAGSLSQIEDKASRV